MRKLLIFLSYFFTLPAFAVVISPTSTEVRFAFTTEFQTSRIGDAHDLAIDQFKNIFGYLQNPAIGGKFGLAKQIGGVGAPRWEPELRVLSDLESGGIRTIRYEASGLFLLIRSVAETLLREGKWTITLPYELDRFYDENCAPEDENSEGDFWYFNDPFMAGCEHLQSAPLARPVTLTLSPAPAAAENTKMDLETLRGDNGNGEVFQIAAINGFDESSKKRSDEGRKNFMTMNSWLREQGFKMKILSHFKNRPIYQFEKTFLRADGSELPVRILRLLADTDLDNSKQVTFAKFLKNALQESDVVIYEGHSGLGVNLDLNSIEKQLLLSKDKNAGDHVEFDRAKHQIFLFDSCSSYSYYLGMFAGKKDPGTLAVMNNGLASLFGYEIQMTKHLYSQLLDLKHARIRNDDLTWSAFLRDLEKPLRGNTFMLNVDLNQ